MKRKNMEMAKKCSLQLLAYFAFRVLCQMPHTHTHTYLYIFILVYCALKLRICQMGWDGAGKKRKHTQVWQLCNKNRRRFIARAWFRVEGSRDHILIWETMRKRRRKDTHDRNMPKRSELPPCPPCCEQDCVADSCFQPARGMCR